MKRKAAPEALLARLVEDPRDRAARLVYADALQAAGDPRGELIALHAANQRKRADALIASHADRLLGKLAAHAELWRAACKLDKKFDGPCGAELEWELGFVRRACLYHDDSWLDAVMRYSPEVGAAVGGVEVMWQLARGDALELLLAHPSGALLDELVVPYHVVGGRLDFAPVIAALARHGAPALRTLRLGEFDYRGPHRRVKMKKVRGLPRPAPYRHEISWVAFGDLRPLWKAAPRLERLTLQGYFGDGTYPGKATLGPIDAPRLQHLELISSGISAENVGAVATATWPELRHLDLWLGHSQYGYSGSARDLAPILDGKRFPKLEHLGLLNAECTDELCEMLVRARVLPRLREISLALGTMTDRGARALAANKTKLAHLDLLDVEHNYLGDGRELLRRGKDRPAICKKVASDFQREPADGRRFVSVGE
jgi:uncharacterized protein (TIGR02996 family)